MSLFIRLRWLTFVTLLLALLLMFSPWTTVQAASGSISVVPGLTFGYIPLSAFGGNTILELGDNDFENISVPGFLYAGQTYTTLGITANGFLVVGGATAAELASGNQNLPDAAVPNNVLAPFWTDLNPGNGGAVLINNLTDGISSWIVVEWERVPDATNPSQLNTFQVWIGINGTQDVSFAYDVVGSGADGLLTVGAENADGSSGQAVFYNGAGTPRPQARAF